MLVKATTDIAFLKVGIYGGPGSGKTLTSLKCATTLGKTAVVDTEHGSDFYATDFDFTVEHTKSLNTAQEVLNTCIAEQYAALIIDQMTHIWEARQEEYIAEEHEKMSKMYGTFERTGNLPWTAWKGIKKPWRKFVQNLLNAPLHVFMLGRVSVDYEQLPDGSPRKVGERMNAEKDLPYEPHILIKMEFQAKGKKNYAYIEKDRSNTIMGQVFEKPGIEMFEPVLRKLGKIQAPLPEGKEDVSKETFGFITGDEPDPSQLKLIDVLVRKGGIDEELVKGVVKGLNRVAAGLLINQMTRGDYSAFKR